MFPESDAGMRSRCQSSLAHVPRPDGAGIGRHSLTHGIHGFAGVRNYAFSLIEVVLALAVIAFAITGIMGLFPVALRSAQESQCETRATLIARQIVSDLKSSPSTNWFIATGTNTTSSGAFLTRDSSLTNEWTPIISYDLDGNPIAADRDPRAIYFANISLTPNSPISGLTRIQVDVEAPALAAGTNPTRYSFVTLLRQ